MYVFVFFKVHFIQYFTCLRRFPPQKKRSWLAIGLTQRMICHLQVLISPIRTIVKIYFDVLCLIRSSDDTIMCTCFIIALPKLKMAWFDGSISFFLHNQFCESSTTSNFEALIFSVLLHQLLQEIFSSDAKAISCTTAAVAKFILFPLIAAARHRSLIGICGTRIDSATSSVTGNPRELSRSLWLIHRFFSYHHINPPVVRKVGILLVLPLSTTQRKKTFNCFLYNVFFGFQYIPHAFTQFAKKHRHTTLISSSP